MVQKKDINIKCKNEQRMFTNTPEIKEMDAIKCNNTKEAVSFCNILRRIKEIGNDITFYSSNLNLPLQIHYTSLAMKVIDQLYDDITTTQIDEWAAKQCVFVSSIYSDYNILAVHLIASNHRTSSFVETVKKLLHNLDLDINENLLLPQELYQFIQ